MSLQFNDTVTFKGIVQIYEKECGFNRGDVSGNVNKLKEFTADCNLAMDDFVTIALKASGTWQFDDSNQSDYPIIRTDIISGQRDYTFVTDESGNLILDIYKVIVYDQNGYGREVFPVDAAARDQSLYYGVQQFYNGQNATGLPLRYDKTGNGILFDLIPNYTTDGATTGNWGIEVYINREALYFDFNDTTKKPGVPGTLHKYFALKPALDYARRNNLAVLPRLEKEVLEYEGNDQIGLVGRIARNFGRRERDIVRRLVPAGKYYPNYRRGNQSGVL